MTSKGIIHLGVLGILFLAFAAVVATRVASDLNINLDPREGAAGVKCADRTKDDCEGNCSPAGYECEVRRGACKTSGRKCGTSGGASSSGSSLCPGTCEVLDDCREIGLLNATGSCLKKDTKCCISPAGAGQSGSTANTDSSTPQNQEPKNPCKVCRDNTCKNSGLANCTRSLNQCEVDKDCAAEEAGSQSNTNSTVAIPPRVDQYPDYSKCAKGFSYCMGAFIYACNPATGSYTIATSCGGLFGKICKDQPSNSLGNVASCIDLNE